MPVILLCLLVWVTIIWARTNPDNELSYECGFAIAVASICWLTIGIVVERIHRGSVDAKGSLVIVNVATG